MTQEQLVEKTALIRRVVQFLSQKHKLEKSNDEISYNFDTMF